MNTHIEFSKYQGTGNDFILIDAFNNSVPTLSAKKIQEMCHRRFGIGADGLIVLRKKEGYDFEMDFYNSNGLPGSMCGNGGRCVIAFAYDIGLISKKTTFWAPDGEHFAVFNSHNKVSLKMQDLNHIEKHELGLFMDTGSPHLVIQKGDIEHLDAFNEGKNIRYSEKYGPNGINVNFIKSNSDNISIITYERGVEDLTYSCGTGTVAAAITASIQNNKKSPINAVTKGGQLTVSFNKLKEHAYDNIWLEGPAHKTFSGFYKHI